MTDDFAKVLDTMTAAATEPEDCAGEDGLLYCGKCRTPKEAFFPADKAALFGRDRHPAECDCQRARRMEREAAEQRRKHLDTVEEMCIRDRGCAASHPGLPSAPPESLSRFPAAAYLGSPRCV